MRYKHKQALFAIFEENRRVLEFVKIKVTLKLKLSPTSTFT